MNKVEQQVREFHRAFGQLINNYPIIDFVPPDLLALRTTLHAEELEELGRAIQSGDPFDLVKEACDLLYVGAGTLVSMGWDMNKTFSAVHRSNMSKLDEFGQPIKRADGKVLKGPNYHPPDLGKVALSHR